MWILDVEGQLSPKNAVIYTYISVVLHKEKKLSLEDEVGSCFKLLSHTKYIIFFLIWEITLFVLLVGQRPLRTSGSVSWCWQP